ncbi:MAG: BMP family ABC transporter substrate-binding protein [Cellulosilyticaceae bacterium]
MKKKFLALVLCGAMAALSLVGCSSSTEPTPESGTQTEGTTEAPAEKIDFKVGMVTDAGTIDDKSFNQGTWEGIENAEKELGIEKNYLKPAGTTEADYLKEITNLYDAGYKFIVTPGFKFETAIFQAQDKYQDAKFVLIDGAPNNGKDGDARETKVADNAVAIFFAEQESGFLAGIATAVEQKEGEVGFIGGMEIPPVQKFNWGFQQGINYANENLGTSIVLKEENVIYQGSFDNVPAGQQIAAQMFDKGVKTIFCSAGGVGVGAITEAVERANSGQEAWIVGVDVDQYADGMYGDKSVILTSAVKKIDKAAYDMINDELNGEFKGGQTLTLDIQTDSVGIPAENPNLSEETMKVVNDVTAKLKAGEIVVAGENNGELFK